MQFNCSAQGTGFGPHSISFPLAPGSPLNDDPGTERKETLCELPLKRLDAVPLLFAMQIDR